MAICDKDCFNCIYPDCILGNAKKKVYTEDMKAYQKEYYQKRKEYFKARNKKYYQEHKEKLKADCKKYRLEHIEQYKAYNEKYKRSRSGQENING